MEVTWFVLVAVMIAVYVILDGFDIGAGIAHLVVAKNENERRQVFQSIGPVWNGNEVWLLAGGGTLYFAFPGLYSSSFSGFYLPLMIVLWLLILRGISIEFRSHLQSPLWRAFWDTGFAGASALLAIFFGAALGNVVRGVPLDGKGDFFLPLWTDFRPGADPGILDWYTIAVGAAAFFALTMHGALWIALKTENGLHERAARLASRVWYVVLALTAIVTYLSFAVQPHIGRSFVEQPARFVFPAIAVAGLLGIRLWKGELQKLLASGAFIIGMLTSAAFGVFPYVLPSNSNPAAGLTIYNSAAPVYGLKIGLMWWIPGMLLAACYFAFVYRHFAGKVPPEEGAEIPPQSQAAAGY